MVVHQWEAWPKNAVVPGSWHFVDPSKPWVPSPESQGSPLPPADSDPKIEGVVSDVKSRQPFTIRKRSKGNDNDPLKRKRSRLSVQYWIDWLRSSGRCDRKKSSPSSHEEQRQVTPAEWKAYGYWARPRIGNVLVRNATPPPVPRNLTPSQVDAVMRSVTGPDGRAIPENWIARLEHPSLPPRSPLWPTPPSTPSPLPPPLPAELQLNAFLQHRRTGKPPMIFDVRMIERTVFLGEVPPIPEDNTPGLVPFHTDGPNGGQPATYPGVSALNITALADDPLGEFPWPFIVLAHHPSLPVTVQDIIVAILANFQECVTEDEVNSLTAARRDQVYRAYWQRVKELMLAEDDGIRRIDYLGDRYMFRGLEPAEVGDGFMIYFGPP